MTLDEAREHIGHGVVYDPGHPDFEHTEDGVITSVNSRFVFVRYGSDKHSKGTDPAALTLLAGSPATRPPQRSERMRA